MIKYKIELLCWFFWISGPTWLPPCLSTVEWVHWGAGVPQEDWGWHHHHRHQHHRHHHPPVIQNCQHNEPQGLIGKEVGLQELAEQEGWGKQKTVIIIITKINIISSSSSMTTTILILIIIITIVISCLKVKDLCQKTFWHQFFWNEIFNSKKLSFFCEFFQNAKSASFAFLSPFAWPRMCCDKTKTSTIVWG